MTGCIKRVAEVFNTICVGGHIGEDGVGGVLGGGGSVGRGDERLHGGAAPDKPCGRGGKV